mgnify:FL=1
MGKDIKQAVLIIAHGSRRQEANDELLWVAKQLRLNDPLRFVQNCYLELAHPTIPEGAEHCVASGADHISLLPYFLSPGRHVHNDLQLHYETLSQQYRHIQWTLCAPLGQHPLILEILKQRLAGTEKSCLDAETTLTKTMAP